MKHLRSTLAVLLVFALALPQVALPANHREAPITALDHKADITDIFAFVSYGPNQQAGAKPSKVTMILDVDPLLEPGNGPTLFPFDPGILYEINVDNDYDAQPDVTFQFRFVTEYQLPDIFTSVVGVGDNGANAPGTSNPVVPPQIRDFDNPGLNLRQHYTVTMVRHHHLGRDHQDFDERFESVELSNRDGSPFFAVPGNAGPRTMDYGKLFDQATYKNLNKDGVSVFAGTVDDPFWIDLGATFDTANFRTLGSGIPGVLTKQEDAGPYAQGKNYASDTVSGYAVNAIAIEVPIELLTRTGEIEPASSPSATVGIWGTTSRPRITVRRSPFASTSAAGWRQVQRMGNPLINELLVGIGSKDRFSMDKPKNDAQFAKFFLDPPIVHAVEALYGGALKVPPAPRNDLLPLVTYAAPIAAPGTPAGPIADLLRLNTGVPATPFEQVSRLGLIGGDPAGYPNGRRLLDDVTDITLRVGVGGVLISAFNQFPNNQLGDGVNVNDADYRSVFPYLSDCPDGRNRRHVDPGEAGGGPVK
jgi:Domain of unknown function (DUF4331)